jgi:hypothetical protein
MAEDGHDSSDSGVDKRWVVVKAESLMNFGFHKTLGISLLAGKLSASQARLL